jgi:class 3 adenylate cyclase/predicted ATPase
MTVLFCDLVDSTALSTRLDVEHLRDVLQTYQASASAVVREFDGHVAQYLGDGLLVYLGYPVAHEDDAERAIRVALGIVAAVQGTNAQLERDHGIRLSVRVGIHSGPVVVSEVGRGAQSEMLALGYTTNLAARLQSIAAPDSVVLSGATLRLVQGLFLTEDLGPQQLKGLTEPIQTYRALRPSGVRSRLDLAESRGLTPLVGREQEIGLLLDRWEQVADGMGQVVLISGEGGIGKSRLAHELRRRMAHTPHTWLECRCSSYTMNSAFYPVIELQAQALRFSADEGAGEKLAKLEAALTRAGFPLAEYLPLFAELHSLPLSADYEPPNLSPAAKKRKTIDAFVELLLQLGRQQTVLLLFEDIHWIDPSTLELLGSVLEQVPTARVFAIFTFRPDFIPPWPARAHVTPILANRLTRAQVAELVGRFAGDTSVSPDFVDALVRRSDGVPLFAEELTRAALESAELTGARSPVEIPATLRDSLMARLDQLGPAKELAQFCATLGRDFTYELLMAVSTLEEPVLREGLDRLVHANLFYCRGQPPRATYMFKHALIQDEAYASLLTAVRRSYHQRIAEALESQFPDRVESQPELVAHHYSEAGVPHKAVHYWLQAGRHGLKRSANVEAVHQLTRGLALLSELAAGRDRNQLELALQGTLGRALAATKGRGSEEVYRAFARARELCLELGAGPQVFPVSFGLWLFFMVRAESKATLELAPGLLRVAQEAGDPGMLLEAHLAVGYTAFWQSDYGAARSNLQKTLSLYNAAEHRTHAFVYGQDPAAAAQVFDAWSLWLLGYADQAAEAVERALTLAERTRHPFTLSGVLWQAAVLRHELGDPDACYDLADRAVVMATEQHFASQAAAGVIMRGAAQVQRGQIEDGLAHIQQGVEAFRASGAVVTVPHHLGVLAHALLRAARVDEGLAVIEEGLQLARTNLDRYYEPELLRIRGELLQQQQHAIGVEAAFSEALERARAHGARSLELRAATSLARFWVSQGRAEPAQELLGGLYRTFNEGWKRRDLQAAEALLLELT